MGIFYTKFAMVFQAFQNITKLGEISPKLGKAFYTRLAVVLKVFQNVTKRHQTGGDLDQVGGNPKTKSPKIHTTMKSPRTKSFQDERS